MTPDDRTLTVRVAAVTALTTEVKAFELVHPRGLALPGYAAGAHIDVHTPGGFTRPYSLASAPQPWPGVSGTAGGGAGRSAAGLPAANAPWQEAAAPPVSRYLIGVKREPGGRGGSAALHERVHPGDLLAISAPRQHFGLQPGARHHLLLAGGIGLTPLLGMAQALQQQVALHQAPEAGTHFTLCVFARSRAQLAFADALAALGPRVRLHLDDPDAPEKLDLAALLARPADGSHLYLCGPTGFMQAARQAASAWADDTVHTEYFAAPDAPDGGTGGAPAETGAQAFTLLLQRRGQRVDVAADQSAVEALRDWGIEVPTSCTQGLCGTCVVPWLPHPGALAPTHRDFCLSAQERAHRVALCCSRAGADLLVVDL